MRRSLCQVSEKFHFKSFVSYRPCSAMLNSLIIIAKKSNLVFMAKNQFAGLESHKPCEQAPKEVLMRSTLRENFIPKFLSVKLYFFPEFLSGQSFGDLMMNFVEWFSKTEAGQRYYCIFLSASYVMIF